MTFHITQTKFLTVPNEVTSLMLVHRYSEKLNKYAKFKTHTLTVNRIKALNIALELLVLFLCILEGTGSILATKSHYPNGGLLSWSLQSLKVLRYCLKIGHVCFPSSISRFNIHNQPPIRQFLQNMQLRKSR
jgi:hypothetical protein